MIKWAMSGKKMRKDFGTNRGLNETKCAVNENISTNNNSPISTNVMRYTVLPEAFRPLTYIDSYDCSETEILSVRMNDFVSLVSLV